MQRNLYLLGNYLGKLNIKAYYIFFVFFKFFKPKNNFIKVSEHLMKVNNELEIKNYHLLFPQSILITKDQSFPFGGSKLSLNIYNT